MIFGMAERRFQQILLPKSNLTKYKTGQNSQPTISGLMQGIQQI